jgi:catechol 2,3-dioxygenase-like lactoylglutathione lyase family enzyme
VEKAKAFYADVLGLKVVMNPGWIATYASTETMAPQISFESKGGSGTPVPDLSIEVEDLDDALRRVKAMGLVQI